MRDCLFILLILLLPACGAKERFASVGSTIGEPPAEELGEGSPAPAPDMAPMVAPPDIPLEAAPAALPPVSDPREARMGAPLEEPPGGWTESTEPDRHERSQAEEATDLPAGAAAQREFGNILYNPPQRMTLNLTERIEVRIGRDALESSGLIGRGEVVRDEIPVSEFMTVRLCCGEPAEDHPFDIVALNSEQQIVDESGFTQWSFDVTPRKRGVQYLTLVVAAHYTFANGDIRTKDTPVKTDRIMITVDQRQELKNWFSVNWPWVGLVTLTPLLSWCVLQIFARGKHSANDGSSVFVSYRRDDSGGYTLAICEYLKKSLGSGNVFMDLEDIPHGEDFVQHLMRVLEKSTVVLVMIGEKWLEMANEKGRRLDDPEDFVRLEISYALQHNMRVIPVLLRNARMPTKDQLPEALQALSTRNAIRIHDDQFEASMEKLLQDISK